MNALATEPTPPPDLNPPPPRFNWRLLLALLVGPALLTCLAVLIDKSSNGPAPGVSIIGGALGGIGCGILLGRRLGRTTGLKILLGLIFAVGCGIAAVTLATFGCLASGYKLDLR